MEERFSSPKDGLNRRIIDSLGCAAQDELRRHVKDNLLSDLKQNIPYQQLC
jgi:hypothetical protein